MVTMNGGEALGFFDYRRGFKIESSVSIRRRRRGEPGPENDAVENAPNLVAGRGKPRETPRENPADRLTPLQTVVVSLVLVSIAALLVTIGFLWTLVAVFYTAVPIGFLAICWHQFRNRSGKGPPLRHRSDR